METVKLTANEIAVLKAIMETGQHEGTQNYMVEDLVRYTGKSVNSIKGILSSLQKKGLIYTYAGEYAFDGNIREEAEEMVNSILNKVNPQNNKTENNMEDDKNPMMDDRIVRMNEIAATKLSSVSKGKRESLKAAKVAIKYIMESWDCPDDLKSFVDDEESKVSQYELWCIAKSRLEQLWKEFAEVMVKANEEAEENAEATQEQAAETTETPKAVENTPKAPVAKNKHEVGELHPTKDWVWTEYKPGKFDWRTNKHNNPQTNHKERERDLGEDKPKKAVKKTNKKAKAEKPVKVRTMEEILATKPQGISAPQERAFKLLRKGYRVDPNAATPQGYTLKKGDDSIVVMEAVMNALINRLKVTTEEIKLFHV